jgi:ABC-2 type transport system permease protein
MSHLLRSELFRLRKRSQSWLMFVIGIALTALFYGAFVIAYFALSGQDKIDMQEGLRLSDVQENGMSISILWASILISIVGASLIGSEYSWNTIRPLLARATSRTALLSAKWLTLAIYTLVLTVVVIGIAPVVLSIAATLITGESPSWSASEAVGYLEALGRVLIVMIPSAALAFAVATLTRSLAAGIAISIGVGFLEPAIFGLLGALSDTFETISHYGLNWGASQLMTYGFEDGVSGGDLGLAFATQIVWSAIFVAASYIVFNRRDVTSG